MFWIIENYGEILIQGIMVENTKNAQHFKVIQNTGKWIRFVLDICQILKRRMFWGQALSYSFADQEVSVCYLISACPTSQGHYERRASSIEKINGSILTSQ